VTDHPLLPSPTIAAETERLLRKGGYAVTRVINPPLDPVADAQILAEDTYGVVAVVIYATPDALLAHWTEAQGQFVERLSNGLRDVEAKVWEGYLVLLTSLATSSVMDTELYRIRQDTHRVRKIVGTGHDIATLSDLEHVLSPLLPLEPAQMQPAAATDPLVELVERVRNAQRPLAPAIEVLVNAFRDGRILLEQLHAFLSERQ